MGYDVNRRPAEWVAEQAGRKGRQLAVWFVVYFGVTGLFLVLAWKHPVGVLAAALLVGVALIVRPQMEKRIDRYARWAGGAHAEEAVGQILNELRHDGWIVMHDVTPDQYGNVDHIVSGPNGVYLIETKKRAYIPSHLGKVKRQAARLHDSLGVWVTPVVCLHERRGGAFKTSGVAIVPSAVLLAWLREQRNRPVEFERLARFADSV